MNKKTVCLALLLFLLTIKAESAKTVRASKIWTVDDDGPADYGTIQEAVDAASVGDTIFVRNGVYLEKVSVTKSMSLVGEDPFDTIIDVQYESVCTLYIEADNVTVKNITLRNSNWPWVSFDKCGGICLYTSDYCNVENCIMIDNGGYGINLHGSDHNNISNNLVTANSVGITLAASSSGNLVKGNWVLNNSVNGAGLCLGPSSMNNTIIENLFCNNSLWVNIGSDSMFYNSASGILAHNSFFRNTSIWIDFYAGPGIPEPNLTWTMNGKGNFWMDYVGVDEDGDGLGDTPYVIPYMYESAIHTYESNNDNYPLMRPHKWIQGDVNYDMTVNILDIAIVAKAFGSHFGSTNWNVCCDLNNDNNINILDISEAALSFGKKMNHPFS